MKKSQKGKIKIEEEPEVTIPVNEEDLDSDDNDENAVDEEVEQEETEETEEETEEAPETEEDKLRRELNEQKDKLLRLQADFDNYRKRVYKDLTNTRIESKIDTLEPVLQVFDHFDMAVAAAETADNIEAIQEGLKMILGEFSKALDEMGIERIDAVGEDFDPNLHEAVAEEASEDVEEGKIIKQWRCGYKMGDRLIRPANVVVSSGPPEE